jgi:hypothetical protein
MIPPDAERRSEDALRRYGRHEHRRWGAAGLQVLLNDEAARGMSDDHGGSAKCVSGGAHVVEIVGNRARTKRLGQVASAMPRQLTATARKPLSAKKSRKWASQHQAACQPP